MCFFARCIYGMNIYIYTHPSLYIHARIHTNLFIHLHVHNILGIVVKRCLNELRVEVAIERKVARQNKAKSGRKGVKKRDMKLPPPKIDAHCANLRSKGLWSWDEDFPGDEEDCLIYA